LKPKALRKAVNSFD